MKTLINSLDISAGLTGLFGITEPALYGVNLRYKTPLYAAMLGGGVGGLYMGITRVRNFAGEFPGLLTLPGYIGDDTLEFFINASIGAAISIVIAFAVTYMIFKDPQPSEDSMVKDGEAATDPQASELGSAVTEKTTETIVSPMKGEAVDLVEVNDGMFFDEILGKGLAIRPNEGLVKVPVEGTVTAVFDSKHAIGITTDSGMELLIHVGIDTVQLNGEGYEYVVEKGQRVAAGDDLIKFDLNFIIDQGFETITPIVITNSIDYQDILNLTNLDVDFGDKIIRAMP